MSDKVRSPQQTKSIYQSFIFILLSAGKDNYFLSTVGFDTKYSYYTINVYTPYNVCPTLLSSYAVNDTVESQTGWMFPIEFWGWGSNDTVRH